MSKLHLIVSILFVLFLSVQSFAEAEKAKMKGPIVITSETLTANNKEHTALFEKNVVAKSSSMTLYADSMLVFYRESGGEVEKIESTGNVKVYKDSKLITSQKAVYTTSDEKVVFTGEPRAVDGENIVTGSKITYFLNSDRSLVENSKVYLKGKKESK